MIVLLFFSDCKDTEESLLKRFFFTDICLTFGLFNHLFLLVTSSEESTERITAPHAITIIK